MIYITNIFIVKSKCDEVGYCTEDKSCGRKPKKDWLNLGFIGKGENMGCKYQMGREVSQMFNGRTYENKI